MKYLILLRHAKSSWKDPLLEDFDRPLNKRGKMNAPLMGQRLARLGERPDVILSSPAKRARRTARMVAAALHFEEAIRFEPTLYEAGVGTLLELVSHFDNAWQNVVLVGHNPGLTELANTLGNCQLENIVTCGVAKLAFEVDSWEDIQLRSGRLLFYEYPRKSS